VTKIKDDSTPVPPGGRAAERLREFERARGLEPEQLKPEQLKKGTKPTPGGAGESADTPARDGPAPPGPEKGDAGTT
jgi:hypothetical protein